jgi:hypothetical protein
MKRKVISIKPLALRQAAGTGQHQDPRPVSCYSPELHNMFSLQPRVPAVWSKAMIFQKQKTEDRKPTGNMQACFRLLKAFLNSLNVLLKIMMMIVVIVVKIMVLMVVVVMVFSSLQLRHLIIRRQQQAQTAVQKGHQGP